MVSLSSKRRSGVLTLAATAAAALYVVMAFVAEPAGALASPDNEFDVDVTIESVLSLGCTASGVSLGNITPGSSLTGTGTCTINSSQVNGYTLKWKVPAGSGAIGNCGESRVDNCGYGTGHLNSYIKNTSVNGGYAGYTIKTFWPTDGVDSGGVEDGISNKGGTLGTPEPFTAADVAAGDIRWAARLHTVSSEITNDDSGVTGPEFGADDTTNARYVNVGTGAYYNIYSTNAPTDLLNGDRETLQFKVIQDAANINPGTTYKTRIFLQVSAN